MPDKLSFMGQRPPPTFQCEFCGATKERRRFRLKDGKKLGYDYSTRFCSKACGYKGRKWRPINPNGHIHSSGYVRLHLKGGGKQLMQRAVMEKTLGRKLLRLETVHHKDGNKLNNAPENLELWSKAHPAGQRVIDKVQFAIEILTLYPDFAKAAGYELRPVEH